MEQRNKHNLSFIDEYVRDCVGKRWEERVMGRGELLEKERERRMSDCVEEKSDAGSRKNGVKELQNSFDVVIERNSPDFK